MLNRSTPTLDFLLWTRPTSDQKLNVSKAWKQSTVSAAAPLFQKLTSVKIQMKFFLYDSKVVIAEKIPNILSSARTLNLPSFFFFFANFVTKMKEEEILRNLNFWCLACVFSETASSYVSLSVIKLSRGIDEMKAEN